MASRVALFEKPTQMNVAEKRLAHDLLAFATKMALRRGR